MISERSLARAFGAKPLGRLVAYGAVAAATFVVDAILLKALIHFAGMSPFSGRLISLPVALFVNWLLNRTIVFSVVRAAHGAEVIRYLAARGFSASVNYAIYSTVLLATHGRFAIDPALAVAFATVVMMTPNFLIMRFFVFRSH